ncbi:hypothetical protein D3C72_1995360 [compost metagenome]
MPGGHRIAGDHGDRAEHMQVLVLGHAQAEVGAVQLLGRILQQPDQGAQRHPGVLVVEQFRADAKALQERDRVSPELADQLAEAGEGGGSDKGIHVGKDQISVIKDQ